MPLIELQWHQIIPDPHQERLGKLSADAYMGNIPALAESIAKHGLLQNLVVKYQGECEYQIVAGERRWRAIGLLIHDGRWAKTVLVPCLVVDGKGWLEQAAENANRQDVPVWRQGHRFIEMVDGGVMAKTIAASIGKHGSYVSTAMQIARGLAPEVEVALDKLGGDALPMHAILAIARCVDPQSEEPNVEEQKKRLAIALGKGKRQRRTPAGSNLDPKARVWARYLKLRNGNMKSITGRNQKLIEAVVAYLEGATPKLRMPR